MFTSTMSPHKYHVVFYDIMDWTHYMYRRELILSVILVSRNNADDARLWYGEVV